MTDWQETATAMQQTYMDTMASQSKEISELKAENERLRKCCAQRGARMQIMREWLMRWINGTTLRFSGLSFEDHYQDAKGWFDADGVPVEDAALRGEVE